MVEPLRRESEKGFVAPWRLRGAKNGHDDWLGSMQESIDQLKRIGHVHCEQVQHKEDKTHKSCHQFLDNATASASILETYQSLCDQSTTTSML